ncbi:MAG: hypothetical protein ACC609_13005 [Methanobacterium formicicum]
MNQITTGKLPRSLSWENDNICVLKPVYLAQFQLGEKMVIFAVFETGLPCTVSWLEVVG